jgi:hypothetical protein
LGDQALPSLYSFPHVKVVELRGDRLSSVHEGNTAAATEFPADARWADDYRRDAQEFLLDPQTFDRTWESIQQGQVVSLGIRVAGLGAGRDRAVADAALRLSTELDPLREPATGSELPDRWNIDNELLPVAESDLNAAATREEELHLPAGVGAIARVRKVFFTSVLKPSPERYNGVFNGIGQRLKERPERLATLLEATERRETDGTFKVHPVAAADLDAEFGGGVVYGDSYAKLYAEGRDASSQIEKMVRTASDYIGRGDGCTKMRRQCVPLVPQRVLQCCETRMKHGMNQRARPPPIAHRERGRQVSHCAVPSLPLPHWSRLLQAWGSRSGRSLAG